MQDLQDRIDRRARNRVRVAAEIPGLGEAQADEIGFIFNRYVGLFVLPSVAVARNCDNFEARFLKKGERFSFAQASTIS